jgi:kumamolisin
LPQLTHKQYEERYGADDKDLASVRKFAEQHNLNVVRESAARRSVILAGTVADLNNAFGVNLKTYAYPGGTYRGRTGSVKIPANLASVIEGVFGLDNRPVAKRHGSAPQAAVGAARAFTGAELAKIYNFRKDLTAPARRSGSSSWEVGTGPPILTRISRNWVSPHRWCYPFPSTVAATRQAAPIATMRRLCSTSK